MSDATIALLWSLLGEDAAPAGAGALVVGAQARRDDVTVLAARVSGADRSVPTLVLLPPDDAPPRGVVVYCHAHGHRTDIGKAECVDGRPALLDPPLGLALARAGHVVVCPDMPGFGERASEGPESALAKALHWRGRTLLGRMLADLCLLVDTIPLLPLARPEAPVGVLGFSMGAFLSFWLAALRPDIAACAHLCGFASLDRLIEAGAHDLHAPYLTVPGLLRHADLQDVAARIAPRPQLVAAGLRDPLTPAAALDPALARLAQAYGPGGDLTVLVDPDAGHVETPRMRAAVLAFLDRTLRPG